MHLDRPDATTLHEFCQTYCAAVANPLLFTVQKDFPAVFLEGGDRFRSIFLPIFSRSAFSFLLHWHGVQRGVSSHLTNGIETTFSSFTKIGSFQTPTIDQGEELSFAGKYWGDYGKKRVRGIQFTDIAIFSHEPGKQRHG